ncbi:MAG: glutaredoxin family protein [Burkholderiaceae bacterium]|nr:glutaredoxin family protein [Burkholderiaceae bacterium]
MQALRPSLTLAAVLCLLTAAGTVQAQQVYRIVGPDGKITFSDRAPSNAAAAATTERPSTGSENTDTGLPYGLRQIAARFPVTLYTGADCAPCANARSLLTQRGVPFTERTVSSSEDIEALRRLSANTSLPFGTIGAQQLQGFSDSEWTQYLDAAGYPKQSQLPSNYRRPPATPLAPTQRTEPPTERQGNRPASAPVPPRTDDLPTAPRGAVPSNPAGIRF